MPRALSRFTNDSSELPRTLSICNATLTFFMWTGSSSELEDMGFLNPSSNIDLYCLHSVVEFLLSTTIENFMNSWNNHPISTANNKSPDQIFYMGLLRLLSDDASHEIDEVFRRSVTFLLCSRLFFLVS